MCKSDAILSKSNLKLEMCLLLNSLKTAALCCSFSLSLRSFLFEIIAGDAEFACFSFNRTYYKKYDNSRKENIMKKGLFLFSCSLCCQYICRVRNLRRSKTE